MRLTKSDQPTNQPTYLLNADDGRVVSNFIIQCLQGKDITVYGSGSQTRSFQVGLLACVPSFTFCGQLEQTPPLLPPSAEDSQIRAPS